jgi:hypothetical protein
LGKRPKGVLWRASAEIRHKKNPKDHIYITKSNNTKMENIEEAKQQATAALEDAKEQATEAATAAFEDAKAGLIAKVQESIAKFGEFIKEKIQGLLASKRK